MACIVGKPISLIQLIFVHYTFSRQIFRELLSDTKLVFSNSSYSILYLPQYVLLRWSFILLLVSLIVFCVLSKTTTGDQL